MQRPFLEDIAEKVLNKYANQLDKVTIVFPNRRAGLFFRRHMAKHLKKPVWSPSIVSMEDFVQQNSRLQLADRFVLITELYKSYTKFMGAGEELDRFFYWGELLLGDFDDIDKYLIDAKYLFTDLSKQKELDAYFDYLTEEQKSIILEFWKRFSDHSSKQKTEFKHLWDNLAEIYIDFTDSLRQNNLAYGGMIYKEVVGSLDDLNSDGPVIFAGFNALTLSEEKIIGHWLQNGSEIHWDVDAFYVENPLQEAGSFIREYRDKKVFEASLKPPYPQSFKDNQKQVKLHAVSQEVGQAKLLGNHLARLLESKEITTENTVVVLADEHLLFPVLSSLPKTIDKVNVTMGFPLANTPLFSLVEHLLELQLQVRLVNNKPQYYFKNVLNILQHPLVQQAIPEVSQQNITSIEQSNWVRISTRQMKSDDVIIPLLFGHSTKSIDLIEYLKEVIVQLSSGDLISDLEKEYAYQFFTQLNRLKDVIGQLGKTISPESFTRLFRQLMGTLRLPFSGEPLNGLQIMGVLETRNLDFENVFILSMNEGVFPGPGNLHSFVPYNLRHAYQLPTYEHQDAIYAYLFYRLLQKAKTVNMYYNTEEGKTGGGEMSRFVQQLMYETEFKIERTTLSHQIKLEETKPIRIEKTIDVLQKMSSYLVSDSSQKQSRLTPSSLNAYLDCRLRFYYKYVVKLYEYDSLQHEIDPAVFGNLLHHTMELLYDRFTKTKKSNEIEKEDFNSISKLVDGAIVQAFGNHYHSEDPSQYHFEGKAVLAREVIRKYALQILKIDEEYAPFEVIGLEAQEYTIDIPIDGCANPVGIKGIIDRIDKRGERVRVLDYKTGRDDKKVQSLESLFDRENDKRNKAAMQTLMYALLFTRNSPDFKGAVIPGILNTKAMFSYDFDYHLLLDKEPVNNARAILPQFEGHLQDLLQEIYSPFVAFDQTEDLDKCKNCPYKGICGR